MLCFRQGALPGLSETVKPSDTLLQENRNARAVVLALFGGNAALQSFTSMRNEVTSMWGELRSVGRSFAQEINLLFHVAGRIVEQQVRDQIVALLPSAESETVAGCHQGDQGH